MKRTRSRPSVSGGRRSAEAPMTISFRDTHCHFQSEEQAEAVAAAALEQGVSGILACASSFPDAEMLQRIAEKLPTVFFAAGVHPHEASGFDAAADFFEKFRTSGKLRAVGEIGLDFYYDLADHETQIRVFELMLGKALELKLPASVHCRDGIDSADACETAYELLKDFASDGGRFVLHSYSGSFAYMERFAELGARFGVNGMITFRRAENIRELAAAYPADRILLETDSPYLAPVPHRGKENTPAFIPLIAVTLARVRGLSVEEVSELTNGNALDLFGI